MPVYNLSQQYQTLQNIKQDFAQFNIIGAYNFAVLSSAQQSKLIKTTDLLIDFIALNFDTSVPNPAIVALFNGVIASYQNCVFIGFTSFPTAVGASNAIVNCSYFYKKDNVLNPDNPTTFTANLRRFNGVYLAYNNL